MNLTRRTCGVAIMTAGGIALLAGLISVAFISEPFPMAMIVLGVGVALFFTGALLCDRCSAISYQDPRQPPYSA